NVLNRVEELRGPSVDSYDKLIAWLAEMAESDNVELDTSVFVSQLNRVCGGATQNKYLGVSTSNGGVVPTPGSSLVCGSRRPPNLRQNSTSCDSHASSDLTRPRGSTRSEDFLDPKSAWRSGVNSRQTTFSDDLEEEDSEVKNASMESLYSSTDRDSELGSMSAYDAKRDGENPNAMTCSPIFRTSLAKRFCCGRKLFGSRNCSSSTGNLDLYESGDASDETCGTNDVLKRRSVSLLNLSPPVSILPGENIPKLVFTKEDDDMYELTPRMELKRQRRKMNPRPVSSSRKPAKFERQTSLQPDLIPTTPPVPVTVVVPPIFTTPPETVAGKPPDVPVFLDDALLDGNIADILFSVEALWPRK
ncbi:uncharacterized protein LOC131950495, partial [Physella acuta]|uniref:uncharacterized protein LOC131950495 n=1 Tax=Physella acuta TaxID=109671 RepID=UPI0027DB053A